MLKRAWIVLACVPVVAPAGLLRIEVSERSDVLNGKSFGPTGPYERIIGKAYFEVDPNLPANKIITDIDKAPRNEKGLVEFSSDIYVLRPRDPARGNGAALYEVSNRGRKGMVSMFNRATGSLDPRSEAELGDGLLMQQGYTLLWLGWQFDPPQEANLMRLYTPTIQGVTGVVRSEFVLDRRETSHSVADRNHIPYAVMNPTDPKLTLTVRDRADGERRTVPRAQWKIDEGNRVVMSSGFEPGKLYELVYTAQNPQVVGLGPTAVRDLLASLKYGGSGVTVLGDQGRSIKRAYGFGVSQSGRFIHDFLYLGFNEDEAGRIVFEGLMPHIGAGKKMFTNYRFAQPGRNMQEHGETLYPGTAFPFSYPVTTDPGTGRTDGWLARCLAASNCPKIIQTDTDLEFYQSFGSLVVTDTKGEPLIMPDNVRLYYLSSLQHAATATANSGMNPICSYPTNPLYAGPVLRALLVAIEGWVEGTQPPASRYPSRADGTLVTPAAQTVGFPAIPGFSYGGLVHRPMVVDHSAMPPTKTTAYPVFVPKTDADGNAVAGVRLPTLAAPVATHLGWNLRKAGFAEGALCGNFGSMLPFANTREDRLKSNDPRLSLAERYPNPGDRAAAIERAARQLVQDRLLLEDDVRGFLQPTN
jgi:hypothetical protein